MPLCVATHNIMNGLHLPPLLRAYARLRRSPGLHLLCVQESVPAAAASILLALGRRFRSLRLRAAPRLLLVYDRTVLTPLRARAVRLPALRRVPLWQRLYTGAEQKRALLAHFAVRRRRRALAVANFHLDAAGENEHRGAQLEALGRAVATEASLRSRRLPLLACGDTNAFTWLRRHAESDLRRMLEPLRRGHGARDAHAHRPVDTHFFARANEPKLGHRIAVAAGKVGIDFPRRYDVICTSLPAVSSGTLSTPASDHDLVWARLRYSSVDFPR
ncbi:hypothetical protein AB1Y20_001669 [Prymnesium parvum]|uniref:Endonuclease/exonuclease/phosphatase domain-containing protein n=1 Tax=Prymnesium parvum TaxID=97485 RepID=A0AB34KCN6_PRYPA